MFFHYHYLVHMQKRVLLICRRESGFFGVLRLYETLELIFKKERTASLISKMLVSMAFNNFLKAVIHTLGFSSLKT